MIYFGAHSALFGLSDDVDANNREGFLRRREAACSRAVEGFLGGCVVGVDGRP